MKKTRKRSLSAALAAVMTLTLAGCNGTKTSTPANNSTPTNNSTPANSTTSAATPANSSDAGTSADAETPAVTTDAEEADYSEFIPQETVRLDVYSQLANYSGVQLGWFADVIKEKFNVEFNIINNPEGTFTTRMESGNLGDIVVFGGYGDYCTTANAGMLLDWEEDDLAQDYAPYIFNNMRYALVKNKELAGSDGKLHGFGHDVALNTDRTKANDYWPGLRFDLYEQLGCPKIATLDDYITVFEQMKEICPTSDSGKETYAVSLFGAWDGDMVMMVKALAALYGWDEFGFGLYNCETNEYQDALAEDGMYIKCLKWYNKLFQKNLLDPNSMTQTYEDLTAKMADGATFFNQFKWMGADLYNTPAHLAEGKAMYCVPPEDAKNMVYGLSIYGNERIWSIGANTQYPELCLAILNWFSTPDGFITTQSGPKGVTWDYNDEGKAYLTELGLQAKQDKKGTTVGSSSFEDGEFKLNNTTLVVDCVNPKSGEVFNSDFWSANPKPEDPEILDKWQEWSGYETADEFLKGAGHQIVNVQSKFSNADRGADLNVIWSQVQTCIKDNSWKAIFAKNDEEFDQIVAEMIKQANDYGYQQCVEFQQGEAARRKAAVEEALADTGAAH